MAPGPIVAHSTDQFRAALAAARDTGTPLLIMTAPGAAASMGVLALHEMVAAARAEVGESPTRVAIDCQDAPGHALAALRVGWTALVSDVTGPARDRIEAIADQHGARLLERPEAAALDLSQVDDPAAACVKWARGVALTSAPSYPTP